MPVAYPLSIRTFLLSGKNRTQPAAFSMAEPRRGYGYAQAVGTDRPVFWDVQFLFTPQEAAVFMLWFTQQINNGIDEFTLPIRTEFGTLTHTCRFLPDSLLDTTQNGMNFGYKASIMARKQLIPADYIAGADLIIGLPNWQAWAEYLDRTINVAMPGA